MKRLILVSLFVAFIAVSGQGSRAQTSPEPRTQAEIDKLFLSVPDPKIAEEDLRVLTSAPHIAGSPEDKKTADFVAQKFREAGLETEIVEYKVWFNYPSEISVDVVAPRRVKMHGPSRERVNGDPYQDDPRIVIPYSGFSPSGDVEAEVVYANYGRMEDFKRLEQMKIDVHGKIVIVRYGSNYRGVKALLAQQFGAAGMLIYSDPLEDGYFKGDPYPKGPWRPATAVQRGSIGYSFNIPGDPTTPGIASLPSLAPSQRTPPQQADMPKVPTTPLSWADAEPILKHLAGPESPREWQGALPFTYHLGPGPVRVRMHLKQDYGYRSIWDVIGRVPGGVYPDEWVLAGNHRDSWVYGAVDPGSGTVAMLEAVRGIGQLLKTGWRPKRSLIFGSWDGEEHGLMGSTEWAEQHATELDHAVAYLNLDSAVSGPTFGASAVPSLKQFMRDVAKAVSSPKGGTVYEAWRAAGEKPQQPEVTGSGRIPVVQLQSDVPVGDLGSGSDYTAFLQHLGIPSTDLASSGSYGVYHSTFDDFAWFKRFADPDFTYEQEMARVFGIEVLRFADADVLPYDYENYGKEIAAYLRSAQERAEKTFSKPPSFAAALEAAERFAGAGAAIVHLQPKDGSEAEALNRALRQAERALLLSHGLPGRPWFRHAIYAPGRYAGYAAAVIPGVNEAIDAGDLRATEQQLGALTSALSQAAATLEKYH
ncbi:MAG TPA: M28 family metallopeptidase [Terriglobales bacterium]|nr:M28 family metallopeptidase [Terriglobales bacterium]